MEARGLRGMLCKVDEVSWLIMAKGQAMQQAQEEHQDDACEPSLHSNNNISLMIWNVFETL